MEQIYRQSHIVVLPSMYEGVPTVLLEAASCGRPIVASDIPGCQAIVSHGINGLLVPVNNPAALADALEHLIMDKKLRQQMGEAGRRIALERFTNDSINRQTAAVYQME
jgi:glycosyltransferase involved in cell wall biosynthesis